MSVRSLFDNVPPTVELIQTLLRGGGHSRQIKVLGRIYCSDGSSFGVGASEIHGSIPQSRSGPYTHIEIACPKPAIEELRHFKVPEEDVSDEEAIYRRVPVDLVCKIIADRGGLSL